MKDNLKDFIEQNLEQFEEELPENLWKNIEKKLPGNLPETKTISLFSRAVFWQAAAAVLVLLSAGLIVYILNNPRQAVPVADIKTEQLPSEIAQAEAYYNTLIVRKEDSLKHFELESPGLGKDAEKDMKTLDSSYSQLKKQLFELNDLNHQQLTDAMIQNLQIRIQLLTEQLEVLKKIQQYQKQKNKPDHDKTSL
jgi:hypothetical protein